MWARSTVSLASRYAAVPQVDIPSINAARALATRTDEEAELARQLLVVARKARVRQTVRTLTATPVSRARVGVAAHTTAGERS